MIETKRGKKVPSILGEVCKYGYTLVEGTSLTGYSLVKTPKGSFVVYLNSWGKNETKLAGPSKDLPAIRKVFDTVLSTGVVPVVEKTPQQKPEPVLEPKAKGNIKLSHWQIFTEVDSKESTMVTPEGVVKGSLKELKELRELWHEYNKVDLRETISKINAKRELVSV